MAEKINYNGKEYTAKEFQMLVDNGLVGQKNDLLSSSYGQAPHGFNQQFPSDGGVFSRPGVDPQMFNAVAGVVGNLSARLYSGLSDFENPEYELLTGVDNASGANPTDYTGTPPTPGFVKAATHRAQFGKFYMGTKKLQLPMTGGRIKSSDVDRQLVSTILGQHPLLPSVPSGLNTELGIQMLAFAVHYNRVNSRVLFDGNASLANNATETGFIQEYDGFDRMIKTGYTDLETGNAVPAMDSTIHNFNSVDVTTSAGTDAIVGVLAEIWNKLTQLAEDTGLPMPSWTLAMRRDLFYAITEVYPRSYLTIGNNVTSDSAGERVLVNGRELVGDRDAMRAGNYLMVMGNRIPVAIEQGIPKTAVGNGWSSSIYLIPMTAAGQRVTYLEGFNQNNNAIRELIAQANANVDILEGGLWSAAGGQTGLGFELYFGQRLRLVMRTPHLAARIENVVYNFSNQIYPRDAYTNQAYYQNGGRYISYYQGSGV